MSDPQTEILLDKLRRAGLSRYEASVYLGLVQDRTARVAEISRRTGVPQPKVYQALESLVEKGFCALGSDVVNRYRPIPPGLAFETHLAGLKQEELALRQLAGELEGIYASGAEERRWAPPIEIVKGLPQIRRLLSEEIQQARAEIHYMGQAPQVPALEVAKALWDRAQAGVQLRMLLEDGYFEAGEQQRVEEDDLLVSLPAERRWTPEVPSKMIVIDSRVALLSIARTGSEGLLALALRQAGLVAHCLASFEHAWERARSR